MHQRNNRLTRHPSMSSMRKLWRRCSTSRSRAQGRVYVGVVEFEYAEFKFVGSGSWVAGVDVGAFDEMITPHAGKKERPRDGAADAAGLVFDCELAGVLRGDARGFAVVPAATDDDSGIRVGHGEAIPSCGLDHSGEADAAFVGG